MVHTAVVACLLAACTSYRECDNGMVVPTLTALWRKREFRCFGQIRTNFTHILFAFGKIFEHVFLIWRSKFYLPQVNFNILIFYLPDTRFYLPWASGQVLVSSPGLRAIHDRGGGLHSLFNSCGRDNQRARELAWPLWPSTACAPYSTVVIAALPVNHRVGLSLKSLILNIRSRVNDRRSLWSKLLSSMIRLRLNVTFEINPPGMRHVHFQMMQHLSFF